MRALIAGALLVFGAAVQADELILHTGSYHETREGESSLNNTNPGIGYSLDSGWVGGLYLNSYKKPSFYAARDFSITEHTGAFVGAATGYKVVSGQPLGIIGGFRWTIPLDDKWSMKLLVAPKIGGGTQTVFHLTLTYKL